jgi:hypothetical protein
MGVNGEGIRLARRVSLVTALLLLARVGATSAQSGSEIVDRVKKRSAVSACVEEVKRGNQYSRFDAYVASDGTAHWIGTERERYLFVKCMDREGYPLQLDEQHR